MNAEPNSSGCSSHDLLSVASMGVNWSPLRAKLGDELGEPFKPTALAVVASGTSAGNANARLMAAAPLMLEAINYVLEHPVTFVANTVAAMLENARDTALGQNAEPIRPRQSTPNETNQ